MEKRAFRSKLCRSIVLLLPIILVLGVLPCAAEATYNLQDLIDNKTVIPIDYLVFSNFAATNQYASGGLSKPDPKNITVDLIGQGTLKQGLRFTLNGELSVLTPSINSMRVITISYEVRHHGGDFIEGNSLVLDPLTAIDGKGARVSIREDIAYEQPDAIKSVIYEVKQNGWRQLSDGTVETPQAVLLPTVSVSSFAPALGQASVDSFEQIFSLVPMIDAGDDLVVFDQVTLEPTGGPIDGISLWELYRKDGDELVLVDSQQVEQATFSNLENGFYEAKLTVTNSVGVSAVDFVNIYAAGPSGVGTEPKIQENAELNLWHFKLKKYKYCKWSIARMLGTFDLPDDFEFNRGDDLVGKVTIQVNRGEEPLVVMSDEIKLKVRKWRYKSEIRSY